jgi:hypothetical protein
MRAKLFLPSVLNSSLPLETPPMTWSVINSQRAAGSAVKLSKVIIWSDDVEEKEIPKNKNKKNKNLTDVYFLIIF